jgi:hypothetical protein
MMFLSISGKFPCSISKSAMIILVQTLAISLVFVVGIRSLNKRSIAAASSQGTTAT